MEGEWAIDIGPDSSIADHDPPDQAVMMAGMPIGTASHRWLMILVFFLAAVTGSAAGAESSLRPDSLRSRVRLNSGPWLEGRLLGLGPETAIIARPANSFLDTLALREVALIQLSKGVRSSPGRAIGGLLVGAAGGGLLPFFLSGFGNHDSSGDGFEGLAVFGAMRIGVAVGGAVGLVVGSLPREEWKTVFLSEEEKRRRAFAPWR